MNAEPLGGRVAIVTGAGRGIGEAIARDLARNGAIVALAARTQSDLIRVSDQIRGDGGDALVVPTDVTDEASVESLFRGVLAERGRVDVLVNNAGVATFEPIAASDSDAWWRTVEVNLKGTYLCSRAVLAHMRDRGSGHIVNILSVAARTPFPSSSAYCASKSAALAFTQVLAAEERSQGIRVTAILPGATRTPFWEAMDTDLDLSAMMPPERVAETVTFVVTQPAGATTGEVLILPPGGIL